jgi:hypothetical protein
MSAFRIGSAVRQPVVPTGSLSINANDLRTAVQGDAADVAVVPAVETPSTERATTADLVQKAGDVYTKWIPGDVLAAYLALTAAFRGTLDGDEGLTPHSWGILMAGFGLAAGLTLLGAVATNLRSTDDRLANREILGRIVLSLGAFALWSVTTPGTWWEVKGWDAGVIAAITFATSFVFALVAEIAVALLKKD